ncbi:MAG: hypothetical protein R3E66_16240 [bacterium]
MRLSFRTLCSDERGSSITEFVIGLPIFILIFSGMGSLYRLNQESLKLKAQTNAELWQEAEMGGGDIIPLMSMGSAIGSISDVVSNGGQAFGIYVDSGIKTAIPSLLPGVPSPCFTVNCAMGGSANDYFARNLLDDNVITGAINGNVSASGWANVISSALSITGSRPAFAAGIRYGEVAGEPKSTTVGNRWGSFDLETTKISMPGVTQPTHRMFAVGLTRIEFARDEVWNTQIPEFDASFDTGSSDVEQAGECGAAANAFQSCLDAGPAGESEEDGADRCKDSNPSDACDGLGNGAGNPLGQFSGAGCPPGTPGCGAL